MKTIIHPLLIALLAVIGALWVPSVRAQVAEGQEMITLPGNGSVHELTLNTQVVTTVTFPSTITLVSGYGMVLNAGAAQELVDSEKQSALISRDMAVQPVTMVHYAQASPDTLALRAVRRGTPCYLTVRCDTTVFLFKLVAGEKANLAVIVSDPAASITNPVREVKPAEVAKTRTVFSAAELLGILSKARQRDFLQTVNPAIYEGWRERRGVSLVSTNGSLIATINEIQQWPQKDALVLRSRVDNKGDKEIRFKPIDVKVRAGDRSYAVQLADGTGVVLPGKSSLLDVVLQGNATGGKEHLSIENDFSLEIVEDHSPPPPNDLLPPAQPLQPAVEFPRSLSGNNVPTVYYDNTPLVMPNDLRDRQSVMPNLYFGK